MSSPLPRSRHAISQQQQVLGEEPLPGETNALAQLLGRLTPLEEHKYPVSLEARGVVIVTIYLALLTTGLFPVLPDTVVVGGWAVWWLGGWITWVMEYAARYWLIEVCLGGLALLLCLYLVVASRWLTKASKRQQWLMFASPLLIAHNVLVLFLILASWAVVILIWAVLIAIGVGILLFLIALWARARS
jgi:hypothetical protein